MTFQLGNQYGKLHKGRHLSEEQKEFLKKFNTGKHWGHHTKEHKEHMSEIMKGRITNPNPLKGKDHPNWKGGKHRNQHAGNKYKSWRDKVYKRDNWTCQKCGARSKKNKKVAIEAHHIKSWSEYPELRLDIDNGITLCKSCHKFITINKIPFGEHPPCEVKS